MDTINQIQCQSQILLFMMRLYIALSGLKATQLDGRLCLVTKMNLMYLISSYSSVWSLGLPLEKISSPPLHLNVEVIEVMSLTLK